MTYKRSGSNVIRVTTQVHCVSLILSPTYTSALHTFAAGGLSRLELSTMQEPEIYEQPVGSRDAEAMPVADGKTYYTGYSGFQTSTPDENKTEEYQDFVFPEDRKLGLWSTTFLIINRLIGNGIYSTPSSIIQNTNSVGATLLFWALGGLMTFW